MNAFTPALVGLTLISTTTILHADVITEWNKTAIDVMKAVNVAGNPWTRSMAIMHVSMADAVNAIQNRYARLVPVTSQRLSLVKPNCAFSSISARMKFRASFPPWTSQTFTL